MYFSDIERIILIVCVVVNNIVLIKKKSREVVNFIFEL